jgi:hypothetical protein
MKRWIAVLLLCVACFTAVPGCGMTVEKVKQGVETAQKVKTEADQVIVILEQELSKLPEGDPARKLLEEKIAKLKAISVEADTAIAAANGILNSIEIGEVTPDLNAALGFIPYGAYIGAGLSVALALMKHAKASKLKTALSRVVRTWDEFGVELTPEEKKAVATIQGAEVTALVHEIKTEQAQV